ncbi:MULTISPECIES: class A sortase [unclassified Enterococcus]|uniref:class A sortase n=1 Tax=unclassified Enterococcus TaxID=2608891 RepID=UPI002475553C|nr:MULTISPECIES: class A sortase [unclassified Enterococcus]
MEVPIFQVRLNQSEAEVLPVENYDPELIQPITEEKVAAVQLLDSVGQTNTNQVGGIWIPEINLNLPVFAGFSGHNQYLGACDYYDPELSEPRKMGERNYVLVGHNSVVQYQLFTPLKNAQKGMQVYITDYEYLYIYQVDYREKISESRVDILEDPTDDESRCATLITCYGGNGTPDRTHVHCSYKGKQLLSESAEHIQKNFKTI